MTRQIDVSTKNKAFAHLRDLRRGAMLNPPAALVKIDSTLMQSIATIEEKPYDEWVAEGGPPDCSHDQLLRELLIDRRVYSREHDEWGRILRVSFENRFIFADIAYDDGDTWWSDIDTLDFDRVESKPAESQPMENTTTYDPAGVVAILNDEIYCVTLDDEMPPPLTYTSDGSSECICVFDRPLWDSENNREDCVGDDGNNEVYEPLEDCIRRRLSEFIARVSLIKLPPNKTP